MRQSQFSMTIRRYGQLGAPDPVEADVARSVYIQQEQLCRCICQICLGERPHAQFPGKRLVRWDIGKVEVLVVARMSGKEYQAQVPPENLAGTGNFQFEDGEVRQVCLYMIQMEF